MKKTLRTATALLIAALIVSTALATSRDKKKCESQGKSERIGPNVISLVWRAPDGTTCEQDIHACFADGCLPEPGTDQESQVWLDEAATNILLLDLAPAWRTGAFLKSVEYVNGARRVETACYEHVKISRIRVGGRLMWVWIHWLDVE